MYPTSVIAYVKREANLWSSEDAKHAIMWVVLVCFAVGSACVPTLACVLAWQFSHAMFLLEVPDKKISKCCLRAQKIFGFLNNTYNSW